MTHVACKTHFPFARMTWCYLDLDTMSCLRRGGSKKHTSTPAAGSKPDDAMFPRASHSVPPLFIYRCQAMLLVGRQGAVSLDSLRML